MIYYDIEKDIEIDFCPQKCPKKYTFMCVQYSYIKTLIRVSSKLWITSSIINYGTITSTFYRKNEMVWYAVPFGIHSTSETEILHKKVQIRLLVFGHKRVES